MSLMWIREREKTRTKYPGFFIAQFVGNINETLMNARIECNKKRGEMVEWIRK